MFKNPVITKEAQVLLKLLRLALGTEPRMYFGEPVEPFPESIDWKEVIRLSYNHKVSALAVDGLKSVNYYLYKKLDDNKKEELKAIFTPWIQDVQNLEKEYNYYLEVIKLLGQLFASHGLKMVLLKGAGLALNYPNPYHRGAGDIDFYLLDENDKPAAKRGDELMQRTYSEMFHLMEHQNTYHTQYFFKGIIIENHFDIIGEFYNHEKESQLKTELDRLITQDLQQHKDIECTYIPSANFTVLFLVHHMFSHCYFGGINLRQLTDYFTFVHQNYNKVDWPLVKEIEQAAGLCDFFDHIEQINDEILSHKNPSLNTLHRKGYTPSDIVADMFSVKNNSGGISNFWHWFRDRKKIKFLTGESWLVLTLRSSIEHTIALVKKIF